MFQYMESVHIRHVNPFYTTVRLQEVVTLCHSAPLKPSCGGFMGGLDPDLHICYTTAVIASLLKDTGFMGYESLENNHCSCLIVQTWSTGKARRLKKSQISQVDTVMSFHSGKKKQQRYSNEIIQMQNIHTFP